MSTELKWYALYTRPLWEKKIARMLDLKSIENYCPLQKVERTWSDRKKILFEPLFKSYVFVRLQPGYFTTALQTDGVIRFVTFQEKPACIRDFEIELIKRFLFDYQHIRLEDINFNIHESVRIKNGALNQKTGTILHIKGKTVKILLPTLGFAMIAEVEKSNIEKYADAKLLSQRIYENNNG
ncbi:MAG TPA: UpxY family transcription antiterminator [Flavitalea sp.]|nr:UpxY family transcription antiterminator [Flavitalea sp.]